MIISELQELQKFIKLKCAVNTDIGERDLAAEDLPCIQIIPVSNVGIVRLSESDDSVSFQITLRICSDRKEELRALEVCEKLLTVLPDFHGAQGHIIDDAGSAAYVDDQYHISIYYTLRSIIGD